MTLATLKTPLTFVGMALVAIGGSVFLFPHTTVEIAVLGLGVALLVGGGYAAVRRPWPADAGRVVAAGSAIAMVAFAVFANAGDVFHRTVFIMTFVAAIVAAAIALAHRFLEARIFLVLWLGATAIVALGTISTLDVPQDIDVVELHEQAAAALAGGDNPYTTGNVAVMESDVVEKPELIQEYTYPPVVLVAYAGASWLLGDARWAGALGVVATLLIAGAVGLRGPRQASRTAAVIALLLASPSTYFLVLKGWTEAVTLPLFALAVVTWTRRPALSAVALGVALASKQYLILALPVLLALRRPDATRRVSLTVVTAVATFVPFLVWDPAGFMNGVVIHHLTRAVRTDAATLAGAGIVVPTALAVVAGVAAGVAIAWRRSGPVVVMFGVAAAVAAFTYLAIRGFDNTWWLVIGMAALGFLAPDAEDAEERDLTARAEPRPTITEAAA